VRVTPIVKDLVLIGGGHAHVHVLKSFGMKPMPGVRVTLIARDVETPYSGMLPGYIAGHYAREQCHIDLRQLTRFAGARLFHDETVGLNLAERRVACRERPAVAYDILSIDIGSIPHLNAIPGALRHATPVKPIDRLAERWERIIARVRDSKQPVRFVTVGGGAAGVEVTLAMRHRLRGLLRERGRAPNSVSFTLVTRGQILASHNTSVRRWFRSLLFLRGIDVVENNAVKEVSDGTVLCANGDYICFDELIWVTQAGAASWLADTGLELDERGFIKIGATLRSISDPNVFAGGDVATNVDHPRPKAGVFAVRQGPPLADNLRRALVGHPLEAFAPQRKFLSLISTGDRCAIASRGRLAAQGATLWHLKDWIDRRWMRKYKELPEMAVAAGTSTRSDDPLGALHSEPMRCGGCGAKVGAMALSRVMARLKPRAHPSVQIGLDMPDDAAVVSPPEGKMLVHTVDFFRAFLDDPYLFGRIAANHALGDIYAMGAEPLTALATATLPYGPENKVEEDLYQMLRGGLDVLEEAGAVLLGGHSGEGAEMALGFTLNGAVDPNRVSRKSGMRPGEMLILTKPLGTGTLFAAEMRGKAKGVWIQGALSLMQQSSGEAARCLREASASASTDVTGFGLIGHLIEMMRASKVDAALCLDAIPALEGALESLAAGISSSLAPENLRLSSAIQDLHAVAALPGLPLLFDPQTAEGLLASVPQPNVRGCVAELRRLGYRRATVIGELLEMQESEPRSTITGAKNFARINKSPAGAGMG
jgi:selenide,water dikinase